MNKTVVFVGGTSYSGSTFFHMMLANQPTGFAAGELRWLFNPRRDHHPVMRCSCGDESCDYWTRIRRGSDQTLYERLFNLCGGIDYIVDSSKSVFWIDRQRRRLEGQGYRVRHLLIWKTPEEIYSSMRRRGREQDWDSVWIRYHQLYFSLIPEWRSVSYRELTDDPDLLRRACEWADIPWSKGQEQYWNKTHHIFGGNKTSRFHLYQGDAARNEISGTFDSNRMHLHRSIQHTGSDTSLPDLRSLISESQYAEMTSIIQALRAYSVTAYNPAAPVPSMGSLGILSRRAKYELEHLYGRRRYRKQLRHHRTNGSN